MSGISSGAAETKRVVKVEAKPTTPTAKQQYILVITDQAAIRQL